MIASLRNRLQLLLIVLVLVLAGLHQAGAEMTRIPASLSHEHAASMQDVAMAGAGAMVPAHHEQETGDHCSAVNCPACGLMPNWPICHPGVAVQEGIVGSEPSLQREIVLAPWRPPAG